MKRIATAALVIVGAFLLGCHAKQDSTSNQSQTQQSTNSTDAKTVQPRNGAGEVDAKDLPTEGLGDPARTYDVVNADPAKHRGKRVAWSFAPLSVEGKRMMCSLNMNDAMGPRHYGIYVVEFASEKAAVDALELAFKPGSTVTGTIAGQVDQFLVVRGRDGVAQKEIPKVTVPLLLYPAYKVGESESGKGKD